MMRSPRELPVCLALYAAAACSSPSSDAVSPANDSLPPANESVAVGEAAIRIVERGGAVHVENTAEGLWEGADNPPLRFEPDGVFGGQASSIARIGGAVVDNDANVYVYDAHRFEITAFSPEGTVLWRAGSEGAAEDQFDAVRGITYDGQDMLWVVNQDGTRLDAWSRQGEHQRSLALDALGVGRSFMGGYLPPSRIALLADIVYATAANEYVILNVGDSPSVEARFRIGAEPMTPIPPGVVLQLSHYFHEDKIYLGGWENYALRVYDTRGKMLRRVSRPVTYLRRPGFATVGDRYLGVGFGGLAAPIVLATGHWLVLASWPTNVDDTNAFAALPAAQRPPIEWASSLDLFDPEGRFLYSLESPGTQMPEIGRPWAVGPRGRLYTVVADPLPEVRRYRVVLGPPNGP